jgi:hypothetical protein
MNWEFGTHNKAKAPETRLLCGEFVTVLESGNRWRFSSLMFHCWDFDALSPKNKGKKKLGKGGSWNFRHVSFMLMLTWNQIGHWSTNKKPRCIDANFIVVNKRNNYLSVCLSVHQSALCLLFIYAPTHLPMYLPRCFSISLLALVSYTTWRSKVVTCTVLPCHSWPFITRTDLPVS